MPIVAVYKFRAIFRATPTHQHELPRDGLSREGLLLLRQETDARSDAAAVAACASFGAFDAAIERYAVIDPAVLDRPGNRDMAPLYASALKDGNAMTYYQNSAPASEEPLVTSAGFRRDAPLNSGKR